MLDNLLKINLYIDFICYFFNELSISTRRGKVSSLFISTIFIVSRWKLKNWRSFIMLYSIQHQIKATFLFWIKFIDRALHKILSSFIETKIFFWFWYGFVCNWVKIRRVWVRNLFNILIKLTTFLTIHMYSTSWSFCKHSLLDFQLTNIFFQWITFTIAMDPWSTHIDSDLI